MYGLHAAHTHYTTPHNTTQHHSTTQKAATHTAPQSSIHYHPFGCCGHPRVLAGVAQQEPGYSWLGCTLARSFVVFMGRVLGCSPFCLIKERFNFFFLSTDKNPRTRLHTTTQWCVFSYAEWQAAACHTGSRCDVCARTHVPLPTHTPTHTHWARAGVCPERVCVCVCLGGIGVRVKGAHVFAHHKGAFALRVRTQYAHDHAYHIHFKSRSLLRMQNVIYLPHNAQI